ncbi:hypothetical protein GOP47_0020800 [Adiantum capillus-veneris]|uniref:Hydroxyproline O-arabinosyltransferase-like domain-containing protein n=1 Tax=Adiantum capillus-veneris TaxID=13818 RepID=A0A9D4UA35_ADICA|nr:hypothetical protein GOP47_0020800 [Adiantum capillus-veneris]
MYYWYKKFQHMPGSEMGGFTRILHSGTNDHLMMEIPTVVVDELPEGVDQGYFVLNRPWVFVQWLQRVPIEEDYIMMAEPDHIIVKPLPNLATEDIPAAFPFFYITPTKYEEVVRKYYPEHMGPVSNVDPIGNSPAIIKKSQLEKIAPTWMNISLQMKGDPEADKTFGWASEMYAYGIVSAVHGVKHALKKDFMIQPPWDLEVGEKLLIHYTYGCDYNMKGELTYGKLGEWRFDKRSHLQAAPPKNLPLPPRGVPESVVTLVKMVNEATANIPFWEEGKSLENYELDCFDYAFVLQLQNSEEKSCNYLSLELWLSCVNIQCSNLSQILCHCITEGNLLTVDLYTLYLYIQVCCEAGEGIVLVPDAKFQIFNVHVVAIGRGYIYFGLDLFVDC